MQNTVSALTRYFHSVQRTSRIVNHPPTDLLPDPDCSTSIPQEEHSLPTNETPFRAASTTRLALQHHCCDLHVSHDGLLQFPSFPACDR